jgi:methylated-DNA-[protein]-cysteine S-methyltransferase
MVTAAFICFDTAIGRCALVWRDRGIVGVQLPQSRQTHLQARIQHRFPHAREAPPPPAIQSVVDEIVALIAGEPRDLSMIMLDMSDVPEFDSKVYAVARDIPHGQTMTYGEIASRLGKPDAARAVGQALGHNPFPIIVPCHRVMGAGGKTGGFSADGGVATKLRLLNIERASLHGTPTLFDGDPDFRLMARRVR